ncbi:MAG: hypothetical protein WEA08_08485 [Woeseia sp.]
MLNIIKINPDPTLSRPLAWLSLSLLALAACTATTPLNSERIAARFGNYDVRVLDATFGRRISSLESVEDGRPVTRTLAIVTFEPGAPAAIAGLHARIVDGASIGATFRDAGWAINKPLIGIAEVTIPQSSQAMATLMNVSLPITAGLHAYWFTITKGDVSVRYAAIVELHHPDYLSVADLERIYGRTTQQAATDRFKEDALDVMQRLASRSAP